LLKIIIGDPERGLRDVSALINDLNEHGISTIDGLIETSRRRSIAEGSLFLLARGLGVSRLTDIDLSDPGARKKAVQAIGEVMSNRLGILQGIYVSLAARIGIPIFQSELADLQGLIPDLDKRGIQTIDRLKDHSTKRSNAERVLFSLVNHLHLSRI